MSKKNLTVIGINPGSRHLGFAICCGTDLRDWGVKNIQGNQLKEKKEKIKQILLSFINQYQPEAVALKSINPSRSSKNLNRFVAEIISLAENEGLKIYQYHIAALERFFSPEKKINKKELAKLVVLEHPILVNELETEQNRKNPYHIRMFEAVALATAGFQKIDNLSKAK